MAAWESPAVNDAHEVRNLVAQWRTRDPPKSTRVLASVIEAGRNALPVPEVPDGLEKRLLLILVLQIISVLPGVNHHERNAGLTQVALMVVDFESSRGARRPAPR